MNWGRRKLLITFTLAGELTEKQAEKIYDRLYKIAERFDLGLDETEPVELE